MPPEPNKKGFETVLEAEDEDDLRYRQLWRVWSAQSGSSPKRERNQAWLEKRASKVLASILLNERRVRSLLERYRLGQSGPVPQTLASKVHFRQLRRQHVGGVLEAFVSYPDDDLRVFTIINENWRVDARGLSKLRAKVLVNQVRTHLERSGVNAIPDPLVMYIHGEFDPVSGMFQLHFHGVTTKRKAEALSGLVRTPDGKLRAWGYVQTVTGSCPIRCQRVKDRPRQFSYLLKSYWPSRGIEIDACGRTKRDRKPQRIPEPMHSLVLLWLDRETVPDLRLLTGFRPRADGRLRLITTVFEQATRKRETGRSIPSTRPPLPSGAP